MTSPQTNHLFINEPFPHFQRSLNLFRPVREKVIRRALIVLLLGWFPLVFLILAEDYSNSVSLKSFFTDFGVHARSLIAAPLLVLVELPCLRRLDEIIEYFPGAGIVGDDEQLQFRKIIASTRSLMQSTIPELIAIVLAYAIATLLVSVAKDLNVRPWYITGPLNSNPSWAGWWYALVSVPLLLVLFFGWLWRLMLWGRFLTKVARMKLRLIAAHPDRTSGLKFLNSSLFAFSPVAFTFGVVAAGSAATRVYYLGVTLEGIQKTIVGVLILVLIVFVSPLLVFAYKLHRAKMLGIFAYGGLAEGVGRSFEEKWLANYEKYASGALEATDFSATTDLYGVVSNVYEMRVLPFDFRGLITLAVSTLIPFLPVVLMTIPLKEFLQAVMRLLI